MAALSPTQAQTVSVPVVIEPRVILPPSVPVDVPLVPPTRARRAVTLTIPVTDGPRSIGDISVTINPDGSIEFSVLRIVELLAGLLDPAVWKAMQARLVGKPRLSPPDFAESGVSFRYDPQRLELNLEIAGARRAARSLQVSTIDRASYGSFVQPARFSAYLNLRTALNYDYGASGLASPIIAFDGAVRLRGVVVESEADLQTGPGSALVRRQGTRLVYDDPASATRWSAGDLRPVTRGYQSANEIAGLAILKSYPILQPQYVVRPRGDRSFLLDRAATVEVEANGQLVRTLRLDPGSYNVRDLPFGQGSNDIRLSITDASGRRELLRYNLFVAQTQLATGLSEFALYVGVHAPGGASGPSYSSDYAVTGFYRRGLSDYLTLGVNAQADKTTAMVGVEGVVSTSVGSVGWNFSLSQIKGVGTGYAASATFQRQINHGSTGDDLIALAFETRSRNFGALGTVIPDNRFAFEADASYSHSFGTGTFATVNARYSRGRDAQPDLQSYRLSLGRVLNSRATLTAEAQYEKDAQGGRFSGQITLFWRLGRFSSLRSGYDSRSGEARLSYQANHGQGVGAYSLSANLARSSQAATANVSVDYSANRAEIGFSHFGSFAGDLSQSIRQASSLCIATALVMADGAVSIGRPVANSFAIVVPHSSLGPADILVDPGASSYLARSGGWHGGVQSSLGAYAQRTVTIEALNLAPGADIGQGSFSLLPPYRGGYKLVVGSDYNVAVLGRLLNIVGEPLALIAGTATEVAHPERPKLTIFTNRDGKFGLPGFAPGKWRFDMLGDDMLHYVIDVPRAAPNIVRLGDLQPTKDN